MANITDETTGKTKDSLIIGAFKAMRPVHWIKNLSLFAAIFLSGAMFEKGRRCQG